MPRKKSPAAPKTTAAKNPQSKTKFILAQPKTMTARDVVAKGKAAGLTLAEKYVWQIRSAAKVSKKAKAKTAPAPKAAAPAAPGRKPGKIAQFVLAQDAKVSAPEVVKLAKAAGLDITAHRVHNIRWRAQQKGKAKTAAKALKARAKPTTVAPSKAKKTKPPKVQGAARRAAPRPAPSAPAPGAIAGIAPLDLAYAVGRLVAEGRTTAAEVADLAAERTVRIQFLEAHLAALRTGSLPVVDLIKIAKGSKPVRASAKPVARWTSKKATPRAAKGKVSTRRDGRTFTTTPKVVAARKWQGQYMGYLRQIPEAEKAKFKAIAKDKGIPVAVVALKKRLGKK